MYTINLQKISQSSDMCALVRLTADRLLNSPYMTLGDFFKGLSFLDVSHLHQMVIDMQESDEAAFNIIALVNILASAEGVEFDVESDQDQNLNYFCVIIGAMMLKHKDVVDVIFENLTFGRELDNHEIVRIKYPTQE